MISFLDKKIEKYYIYPEGIFFSYPLSYTAQCHKSEEQKHCNKNNTEQLKEKIDPTTFLPPSASGALKVCSFTVCLDMSAVLGAVPYKYMVESMYGPSIVSYDSVGSVGGTLAGPLLAWGGVIKLRDSEHVCGLFVCERWGYTMW